MLRPFDGEEPMLNLKKSAETESVIPGRLNVVGFAISGSRWLTASCHMGAFIALIDEKGKHT